MRMLNPNCSEVCWRLDITKAMPIQEQIIENLQNNKLTEDDWDMYSDGNDIEDVFEQMIRDIKEVKGNGYDIEKIKLRFTDEYASGGSGSDLICNCFDIALNHCNGKITREKAINELNGDIEYDD